jgi:hypothetical protein
MGKYRFVDPEVHRIEFDEGDWIEVRKELSISDELQFSKMKEASDVVAMLRFLVLDWSLCDQKGNKMAIGEDTVSHLKTAFALEMTMEIRKYYSSSEAEEKKTSQTKRSKRPSISSVG